MSCQMSPEWRGYLITPHPRVVFTQRLEKMEALQYLAELEMRGEWYAWRQETDSAWKETGYVYVVEEVGVQGAD